MRIAVPLFRDGVSPRLGCSHQVLVARLESGLSRGVRKKLICGELERVVVEAVHMQIDKESLGDWFNGALEKFDLE